MEKPQSFKERNENELQNWRQKEKLALELLRKAGELRFDRSVELVLFRKDVYDTRPSQLLNEHNSASNFGDETVTIEDTMAIVNGSMHARLKKPDGYWHISPSMEVGTTSTRRY